MYNDQILIKTKTFKNFETFNSFFNLDFQFKKGAKNL